MSALYGIAHAVPAKPIVKTFEWNGEMVTAKLVGDENCHFWFAEDGRKFQQINGETFVALSDEALEKIKLQPKRIAPKVKERLSSGMMPSMSRAQSNGSYVGSRKGLVILVNFADNEFTSCSDPKTEYTKIMSEIDHKDTQNYGSVRDYFRAQSYGKFDFIIDVVGPYTLSQPMKYYGENNGYGNDTRPGSMILEAVQAADKDVDFSQYDWDGDGTVEQIYVLYAGYGESHMAEPYTVWAHSWNLRDALGMEGKSYTATFDDVNIYTYACGNELSGTSGNKMDGIGIICHEFSHCFGVPDLYCTDYNHKTPCMEKWSVMDLGFYNDNGFCPCSYTAYERWLCGWLEPTVLSDPQNIKDMSNIDDSGEAYIIYNEGHTDEYYVIQNIQQTGWNTDADDHGLLILHVDYDQDAWQTGKVNVDESHLRLTPICADSEAEKLSGALFPGKNNVTSLTDTTTPAMTLYNYNIDGRKFMGKPITNITEDESGLISFAFNALPTKIPDISEALDHNGSNANILYNVKGQRVGKDYKGIVINSQGKKSKSSAIGF